MNYITFCNNDYFLFLEPTLNKMCKEFGDVQLHILCLDQEVYRTISEKYHSFSFIKLYQDKTNYNGFHSFGERTYIELCHKKFLFLTEIVKSNHGMFYFFDSDVIFLKDPTEYVYKNLINFDILFQQDAPITDHHYLGHTYVCAGNFCINKTEKSINFLNNVLSKFSKNTHKNDQEILYDYLVENCDQSNQPQNLQLLHPYKGFVWDYPNAKLGILDPELFQNGFDSIKSNWYQQFDPFCVHLNHMVGKDEKIKAFSKLL